MHTRYKTLREYAQQITVAHTQSGGVSIYWSRASQHHILYQGVTPWNTKGTKRSFLTKLYFQHVLRVKKVSLKIRRAPGFEWLGARGVYKQSFALVVDGCEMLNPATGEMKWRLWIITTATTNPFEIFEDDPHFTAEKNL
jgi:hypothetical protein